jgi:hypothetical protein
MYVVIWVAVTAVCWFGSRRLPIGLRMAVRVNCLVAAMVSAIIASH